METTSINDGDQQAPGCTACKCSVKGVLKSIALILAVAIAVFCIVVATRPNEFKVTRSLTMAATPAAVFEQVNDFHKWDAWSPWVKIDPDAKTTYEGPTSGQGAKFFWAGNSNVGEGSMTILESEPNDHVRIQLDFVKPMAGTSDVLLAINPEGDDTQLTWSMSGNMNFISKAMSLFMDCDKMIGDNFEKGLANLKAIVEAKPEKPAGA